MIYIINFDNCSESILEEDFHQAEVTPEKTREIDNEARISKTAEMKSKFNRNQKHITP